MKLHGQEPVSFDDVKNEIFDMVKPEDPLAITLQDLLQWWVLWWLELMQWNSHHLLWLQLWEGSPCLSFFLLSLYLVPLFRIRFSFFFFSYCSFQWMYLVSRSLCVSFGDAHSCLCIHVQSVLVANPRGPLDSVCYIWGLLYIYDILLISTMFCQEYTTRYVNWVTWAWDVTTDSYCSIIQTKQCRGGWVVGSGDHSGIFQWA